MFQKKVIQNAHYSKVNVYLHCHMQSCVKNVFRLKIAQQVGGKGVLNRFQHKPNNDSSPLVSPLHPPLAWALTYRSPILSQTEEVRFSFSCGESKEEDRGGGGAASSTCLTDVRCKRKRKAAGGVGGGGGACVRVEE